MRNPTLIRDRVLARTLDMLEHLRIQVSCLAEPDREVLQKLERPQQYDLGVTLADRLMELLGHVTTPSEPRFNKTRRQLTKKVKRRGRGVLKPEDKALLGHASVTESVT